MGRGLAVHDLLDQYLSSNGTYNRHSVHRSEGVGYWIDISHRTPVECDIGSFVWLCSCRTRNVV